MIEHQVLKEMDISIYQVAKKGNWCSGDAFYTVRTDNYILCAMADGLGSGEEAMSASSAAMSVIKKDHDLDTESLMDKCNQVMWGTRGVVLTILKFDFRSGVIEYTNVGNISCTFYKPSGELYRPVPVRGYLSGKKKKFKTQRIPYEKDTVFIIYSDGVVFDPVYHALFSKKDTPERMLNRVVDLMEESNDDTTLLVGKVN
ncbi:SpoIIE family protein phosphatase [Salipaludibacillus aurantiacus]|uniref:Negative regulator of sigma-B (Phosphoserine phosphatase) n=1 Tax=Salipaludibacillus aurantiacus TaxID=1601833 RepID=A0A1H9WQZ7_9BACI|nr:SpoIIE family protein phosphatase [Salipaludibacillus aurantiacus]SES36209.1 negative regulator of sigma-B (phosphoserine phosphatase) [Salipaludibacillus aurantiacus]